ncbi:hypothetical protein C491_18164 [Natronococcus amylolyticus DSM 10524]|uniref:Uncharacterized protein n=1 Tax=Natronococcus amylolyticus DSM 10524 TaxID=1227497 RepID=L9X1V8_9EURY|nr:hypothetical protein C491_18164 [Natronococcus amylolyticus DSM 10524]
MLLDFFSVLGILRGTEPLRNQVGHSFPMNCISNKMGVKLPICHHLVDLNILLRLIQKPLYYIRYWC